MKLAKRISVFFIIPMGMYALGFYSHMKLEEEFYPNRYRTIKVEQVREEQPAGGQTGETADVQIQSGGVTAAQAGETADAGIQSQNGTSVQQESLTKTGQGEMAGAKPQVIAASVEDNQVISADTQYIIQEVDLKKDTSVETQWKVPDMYIGMDRKRFLREMELYQQSPSLKDQELGFVSVEVVSFSKAKVVVRKSYLFRDVYTSFYLVNEKNYVVVYCDDLKTIYMNTNITLDSLPDKLKQEIIQNKYIATEEELYNFLESYSS